MRRPCRHGAENRDYFVVDLIGNPLVVVRGPDRIRVLSRVCLHRWALLAEGAGNVRRFTCPFHAWSYGLDGQLLAAAFMDQAEGFARSQRRLPEIQTKILEETGLIFISLAPDDDGAGDLAPTLLEQKLAGAACGGQFQERTAPTNWKTALEEILAASPPVRSCRSNMLLTMEDGAANLTILYPNGPDATIVRTVVLLETTGEPTANSSSSAQPSH